jgi:hypothetical protein
MLRPFTIPYLNPTGFPITPGLKRDDVDCDVVADGVGVTAEGLNPADIAEAPTLAT